MNKHGRRSRRDLEKLGASLELLPSGEMHISWNLGHGMGHTSIRVGLQNSDSNLFIARACRYGWKNGYDYLGQFRSTVTFSELVEWIKTSQSGRLIARAKLTDEVPDYWARILASMIDVARIEIRASSRKA